MNPLAKLKNRIRAAIVWRIQDEVRAEREVIKSLSSTVQHVSTELTDQNRVVMTMLEDLEKRLQAVERKLK